MAKGREEGVPVLLVDFALTLSIHQDMHIRRTALDSPFDLLRNGMHAEVYARKCVSAYVCVCAKG